MKLVKLFLPICLLLVCLCACGGPAPASDAQLREDLEHSEVFRNWGGDMERTVSNIKVKRRQTDVEDKTDTVWISADTKSDVETGNMHFVMTYQLYNEGWLLSTVEADALDEWQFVPLAGPSRDRIDELIPEGAERNLEEFHLDEGLYQLTYNRLQEHKYCDLSITECLYFEFDFKGGMGWVPRIEAWGQNESWHLDGLYQRVSCETGEVKGYMTLGPMTGSLLQVAMDDWPARSEHITFVDGLTEAEALLAVKHDNFFYDYHNYGFRNARIVNGNWSDIRRIAGKDLFIGPDHIYYNVYHNAKFPREGLVEFVFLFELVPVSAYS